jgi:hypothetical protein
MAMKSLNHIFYRTGIFVSDHSGLLVLCLIAIFCVLTLTGCAIDATSKSDGETAL